MEKKVINTSSQSSIIKVIDDNFTSINDVQNAASYVGARIGKKIVYDVNDKATTLYFIYEIR